MTNISDLFNHFMSLINLKYYTKIESDNNFSQINHTHSNIPNPATGSSLKPLADTTSASLGSSSNYARADHTHPKSSIYAQSGHNHTALSGMTQINVTGANIPFLSVNNDEIYTYDSRLVYSRTNNNIQYSKNNVFSELATMNDITNSVQDIAQKINISDIKDNLTSTDTDKPLSAKQGKVLSEAIESKTISIEKQTTAENGFTATYVLKQGNNPLSPKINIPKDFLLKNATLETVGATPTSIESNNNLVNGDKYLKFIVNTQENDDSTTLIIPVNDLIDSYMADGSTIVLNNNTFSVKSNVFADKNHTHSNYVDTTDYRLSDARTPLSHTHIEYTNPTICDDLITNDNTQVLSAKQGKVLKDLIGDAITYINQ